MPNSLISGCGKTDLRVNLLENFDCGLSEEPALGVVARHDAHADGEVSVAREQVDGAPHVQRLLGGGGGGGRHHRGAQQHRQRQKHQSALSAPHGGTLALEHSLTVAGAGLCSTPPDGRAPPARHGRSPCAASAPPLSLAPPPPQQQPGPCAHRTASRPTQCQVAKLTWRRPRFSTTLLNHEMQIDFEIF